MGTISKDREAFGIRFGGIRTKIIATHLIIVMAVLILFNIYSVAVSRDLVFAAKNKTMISQAITIGAAIENVENPAAGSVSRAMGLIDTSDIDGVVIMNADELLLYDSRSAEAKEETVWFEKGMQMAFFGRDWFYSEFRDGRFASLAAVPIMNGEDIMGAALVYQYDEEQGDMIMNLCSNILRISVLVLLVAAVLSMVLSETLVRRMRGVLDAIKAMREGEYSFRVKVTGEDELADLENEFNSLADRLQSTEEVRRRFVSDASHELKTPLASIKILADSIVQSENVDMETVREFVGDIGDEAERLARTTEKLLALTKKDNNIISARERVDMCDMTRRVVQILKPIATENGVDITWSAEGNCTVFATQDDIRQIIINLIENAIKYNVFNGNVDIKLCGAAGEVVFTVEDTGIGIPESDIPHIFDRFYRVDKARSREAGGSGLGLSIVHSAVLEHGGEVFVERLTAGGTRFTVKFPQFNEQFNEIKE